MVLNDMREKDRIELCEVHLSTHAKGFAASGDFLKSSDDAAACWSEKMEFRNSCGLRPLRKKLPKNNSRS